MAVPPVPVVPTVPVTVLQGIIDQFQISVVANVLLAFILVFMLIVIRGVPWKLGIARLRRRFAIGVVRKNNKLDLVIKKKYTGTFVENEDSREAFQMNPDAFMDFGGIRIAFSHESHGMTLPLKGFALIERLRGYGINTVTELFDIVDYAKKHRAKTGKNEIEEPFDFAPKFEIPEADKARLDEGKIDIHFLTYLHAVIGFFVDDLRIPSGREFNSLIRSAALAMTGNEKANSMLKNALVVGMIMVIAALGAGMAYNMTAGAPHAPVPQEPVQPVVPPVNAPVGPNAPVQPNPQAPQPAPVPGQAPVPAPPPVQLPVPQPVPVPPPKVG